jgi:hypothetical protein
MPLVAQLMRENPRPVDAPSPKAPLPREGAEAVPEHGKAPHPPARKPAIATTAQLRRLRPGLTYSQCVQVLGSEGEPSGYDRGGAALYSWQVVDGRIHKGKATLAFSNGVLSGREFSSNQGRSVPPGKMDIASFLPDRPPSRPPYICRSVYSGIKDGCHYAECVRLLGMEGRYLGRKRISAGTRSANGAPIPAIVDVYVWHQPATQATLTLSFRDGKLTARELSIGRGAGSRLGGGK